MAEKRGVKLVFDTQKKVSRKMQNKKTSRKVSFFCFFVANCVVQRVVRVGESESEIGFN